MIDLRNRCKIKLISIVLILAIVFGIIVYNFSEMVLETLYPRKYASIVERVAENYGLDEPFLYAVIKTESDFDKNAVSDVGAMGLTQIMPDTFKWLKSKTGESLPEESLFEPEVSIKYGGYLLNYLLDEFENPETAVAAYHAGINCVKGWLADSRYSKDGKTLYYIPYGSTAEYTRRVVKNTKIYIELYDYTEEPNYEY